MGALHTPGPWANWEDTEDQRVAPDDDRGITEAPFGVCAAKSGVSIADLWFGTDCGQHISREEVAANARLIAAAPDLLAALRSAHETLLDLAKDVGGAAWLTDPFHDDHGPLARIEAAIARAEGRS